MILTQAIPLARGAVEAVVIPSEGAVLSRLSVAGREVLAETPWGADRPPAPALAPAADEGEWVERWRGGWQLCFPLAGEADPGSPWPQGFHGVASQAPWRVVAQCEDAVVLEWADEHGLEAHRTWELTATGATVSTVATNHGTARRALVIAEHLILGGEVLAPVMRDDAELAIAPPPGTRLARLDYEGRPDGERRDWPGTPAQRWSRVARDTPARVAAVIDVDPRVIRVEGAHVAAAITWSGLAHALLWEELAQSTESPWNGSIVALGIEPTSAPHGRGSALDDGLVQLEPGRSLSWSATLSVDWLDAHPTPTLEEIA